MFVNQKGIKSDIDFAEKGIKSDIDLNEKGIKSDIDFNEKGIKSGIAFSKKGIKSDIATKKKGNRFSNDCLLKFQNSVFSAASVQPSIFDRLRSIGSAENYLPYRGLRMFACAAAIRAMGTL